MTLVELIAPVRRGSRTDQCLAILYYHAQYKAVPAMSVRQVRSALSEARLPQAKVINVADALARSGEFAHSAALNSDGHKLWELTQSGMVHVRQLLGVPDTQYETDHDVAALNRLSLRITDAVIQGYIDEAVLCLRVNALRAAIVFLWSGAIRTLQERALLVGPTSFNAALVRHDPKAKPVSKIDDFATVKDVTTLLVCRELALIDKGEWQTLGEALGLRNRCGHPTTYRPGVKKASSFIEDVVGIVFL